MELALPHDLPVAGTALLVVALDEDVSPEGDAGGDGDTHLLHVVCHVTGHRVERGDGRVNTGGIV